MNTSGVEISRSLQRRGFTMTELLVVIAIIGVLGALLFPAVSQVKSKARSAACVGNLRQLAIAMRMYWDDNRDYPPGERNSPEKPTAYWTGYKRLLTPQWLPTTASKDVGGVFRCPADRFFYDVFSKTQHPYLTSHPFHTDPLSDGTSYFSNAGALTPATNAPGLKGTMMSSVRNPSRTVLIGDMPAFLPYSWHEPKLAPEPAGDICYQNAKNPLAFVDGHVSIVKVFWNEASAKSGGTTFSMNYDPPADYPYQWSAD